MVRRPKWLAAMQGAGTGEGVEHDVAGSGEGLDQRRQDVNGLLRRMQFVVGVYPLQNVRQRRFRKPGLALEQQIGAFAAVLNIGRLGGVLFAENDMPAGPKPRAPPRRSEQRDFGPAIEADGARVGL